MTCISDSWFGDSVEFCTECELALSFVVGVEWCSVFTSVHCMGMG
jgi:hypothetical protein